MRNKNSRWISVLIVGALSPIAGGGSPSEKQPSTRPGDLVALALQAEARGDAAARAELLDEARQAAPDDSAVRWQTGHVWHADTWMKPDEAAAALEKDLRLVEYRNIRDDFPDTPEAQLELAAWCARKGLHDQQRAHLTRVLEFNPNHVGARRELGFRWVEGVWLSAEEQIASARRAQEAELSLSTWPPKLVKLRDALERRNQRQRDIALERLLEIKDPLAIPALEAVFAAHSEPAALAMVDVLDRIEGTDAATALARQAVFSPSEEVRGAAAKKLHARPYEQFVPVLLSGMYTPVQTRTELYWLPNGRLLHQHAFYREGMSLGEFQLSNAEFRPSWAPRFAGRDVTVIQEYAQALLFLQKRASFAEKQAADQNKYTAILNESICEALKMATNEVLPPDPNVWWRWWADRNEVEYYDDKPVDYRYFSLPFRVSSLGQITRASSCLVAGTLVWTETGFVPVERLRAGDRVLAQDPESGELTYKPVLRTTRRDPVETLRIDAGPAGALTCSGGHLFWVSGKGWVRARVMEPGTMLHTLDGPREVLSVQKMPQAEVFNLIVADFHSYFVANGRWLTHDNTPQSPTTAVVPGLAAAR